MARDLRRLRVVRTRVRIIASFPGLHTQLLSLAVRTASDKSWAWRPGNEAIRIVSIITCMRTLRFCEWWICYPVLVLCFLSTRLSAVPLQPSTHNFETQHSHCVELAELRCSQANGCLQSQQNGQFLPHLYFFGRAV